MGWYPGIIGNSGSSGVDLVALCAGSSTFDLNSTITSASVIPKYMFYQKGNVGNIDLPSVISIEESAFQDRLSHSKTSINLPNCVTVAANAFNRFDVPYYADTVLNLPKCTTLGQRAFGTTYSGYGIGYELLNLPKIETIGPWCFQQGIFGTIIIGNSCSSIGNNAFLSVVAESLRCEAVVPPVIGSGASNQSLGFTSIDHIYVPSGSVSAYQSAFGWANYASIIEAIVED